MKIRSPGVEPHQYSAPPKGGKAENGRKDAHTSHIADQLFSYDPLVADTAVQRSEGHGQSRVKSAVKIL